MGLKFIGLQPGTYVRPEHISGVLVLKETERSSVRCVVHMASGATFFIKQKSDEAAEQWCTNLLNILEDPGGWEGTDVTYVADWPA